MANFISPEIKPPVDWSWATCIILRFLCRNAWGKVFMKCSLMNSSSPTAYSIALHNFLKHNLSIWKYHLNWASDKSLLKSTYLTLLQCRRSLATSHAFWRGMCQCANSKSKRMVWKLIIHWCMHTMILSIMVCSKASMV